MIGSSEFRNFKMKRINLTNSKFNKLTVTNYSHTAKPRGEAFWECLCDCGEKVIVSSGHLKSNHTKSCGCLQIEIASKNNIGNTRNRKYEDPKIATAKSIWKTSYSDGCSFERFLELSQQNCTYCGIPPFTTFNKYIAKAGNYTAKVTKEWAERAYFTYNGLDRIDSELDHQEDNIVTCCIVCNRAKHSMSVDEFFDWIERVHKNKDVRYILNSKLMIKINFAH